MHRFGLVLGAIAAAGVVGGCGSLPSLGNAPQTPPPQTLAPQRSDGVHPSGQPNAYESAIIAEGNPTGLYALIARGALTVLVGRRRSAQWHACVRRRSRATHAGRRRRNRVARARSCLPRSARPAGAAHSL